jgi:hypothetical protein
MPIFQIWSTSSTLRLLLSVAQTIGLLPQILPYIQIVHHTGATTSVARVLAGPCDMLADPPFTNIVAQSSRMFTHPPF